METTQFSATDVFGKYFIFYTKTLRRNGTESSDCGCVVVFAVQSQWYWHSRLEFRALRVPALTELVG